jgi:hypothetical protein
VSKETPALVATPDPLGTQPLWHTPGKKLPNYIEHIAHALQRNGMSESQAIATAINAVKRWAQGKGKVTPEVIAASQRTLAEWEQLKEHH